MINLNELVEKTPSEKAEIEMEAARKRPIPVVPEYLKLTGEETTVQRYLKAFLWIWYVQGEVAGAELTDWYRNIFAMNGLLKCGGFFINNNLLSTANKIGLLNPNLTFKAEPTLEQCEELQKLHQATKGKTGIVELSDDDILEQTLLIRSSLIRNTLPFDQYKDKVKGKYHPDVLDICNKLAFKASEDGTVKWNAAVNTDIVLVTSIQKELATLNEERAKLSAKVKKHKKGAALAKLRAIEVKIEEMAANIALILDHLTKK